MKVSTWQNCYDNQWSGLIVSEAFSHPAKFSPGLIQKIYSYGIERGWFAAGDVIGDPFGGIGGGGIFAAYARLKWVGVEIEEKFINLCHENFMLHADIWKAHGYPIPIYLQGDSRRFSEIVGGLAGIITSPPYVDQGVCDRNGIDESKLGKHGPNSQALAGGYGKSNGQIGQLKAGDLKAIVTSPPYISGGHHPDQTGAWGGKSQSVDRDVSGYGNESGQIGKLKPGELSAVVTSPPYADSVNAKSHGIDWTKADPEQTGNRKRGPGCKHEETFRSQLTYSDNPANIGKLSAVVTSPPFTQDQPCASQTKVKNQGYEALKSPKKRHIPADPGNIGNLKMDSIVTSPPYSEGIGHKMKIGGPASDNHPERVEMQRRYTESMSSENNIGKENGETYWQAMAQVYTECWKALKPGGYLIVVVKAYVKNKKRVPLPQQTLKLLIHLGFEPIERIKAMLTKETIQGGLFGEDIVNRKERKSFFRRLAESKGSPRIDFEEVLVVRKP